MLQPVIQATGLGLHPAVVVLAVSAGGTLRGVLGALLAVPLAALVYRYAREVLDGRDPTGEVSGGGRHG